VRAKTDAFSHGLYYQPSDFAVVDRIGEVARQRGVSNARVALAWLLAKPGVTAPIIGASKMGHLEDLVGALDLRLEDPEIRSLEECYQPHRVLGHS
jgi:aryl-alcohol dehydrogenase (NADP+)